VNSRLLMYAPEPDDPTGAFAPIALVLDALLFPVSYSDRALRYRYVNEALAKRYRLSRQEIIGRTVAEIEGEHSVATLKKTYERVLNGYLVNDQCELDGAASGSNWWHIERYPNRNRAGEVVGFFTFSRDISASKALEREVQEREQQIRQLVESINLPMARWNREGRLVFCNSPYEKWVRRPRSELLGLSLAELFGASAWTTARSSFERAFAGQPTSYERQVKQPDGSLRWHRVQVFPDLLGSRDAATIFTIAFDIDDDIRLRQQLAANEARIRSVVDAIELPIARVDKDLKITYCNKPYALFVGKTPETVVGATVRDLFGENVERSVVAYYKRAFDGESVSFDRLTSHDATARWIRIRLLPDRDAAGNVRAVYATAYDIDADVRSTEKLEETRRRLDVFTDNIPFPLTYLDRDGYYRFANRAFLERHNLLSADVVGRHPIEARGAKIWDEYKPYVQRALSGETVTYEREVTLADGEARWTRTVYAPDRDPDGNVQGVYTSSFDVHEIKRAQLELTYVNAQLSAHLDRSPVAVIEYDAQGHVVQWSRRAREILGSSASEMIGKRIPVDRVHPDDREEVAALTKKITSAQVDTVVNMHRYRHADGHYVWIEWYTSVAKTETGTLKSVLSIGIDTTARVEAERRLQRFGDRIPNPVTYLGKDCRYQFMNLAFQQWTGITPEMMLGKTPVEARGQLLGSFFQSFINRALAGEEVHIERLTTLASGEEKWVRTHFSPDRDESGQVVGCYNVSFDIHQTKLAEQALVHAANHDALTNALSRNAFFKELDRRLANAEGTMTTLLFVDLDGFKNINDTLGHAEGDNVLIQALQQIRAQLKEADIVGRLGGDEFVVLTQIPSATIAKEIGERIIGAIKKIQIAQNPELSVSASVGIAMTMGNTPGMTGDKLVREADQAMYTAKRTGQGQVRFAS
jgi:diguanylate cyclase (GGDEF)-like protein/PAS domain S-box-containing protein